MKLTEKFHQPENFDPVADGAGWTLYAGENDWERAITAVAVVFHGDGTNKELDRLWMTVDHKHCPQKSEFTEETKKWGKEAWRTWKREAQLKHKATEDGKKSWQEAFKEALKSPAMKPYVRDWGEERSDWKDVEETASVRVAALLEADDPDDPETFLQSHPGFDFRHTQFMGYMVFVLGPGEDRSEWPQEIGHVVEGPGGRWYVVSIRGIPDEHLVDYKLGLRQGVEFSRNFDTKEDAAMAIWLIRSRMPEKKSVLAKRRPYRVREAEEEEVSDEEVQRYIDMLKDKPTLRRFSKDELRRYLATRPPEQPGPRSEPHRVVREGRKAATALVANLLEADEPNPDEFQDVKAEFERALPVVTLTFKGNGLIHAPGVIRMAQSQYRSSSRKDRKHALELIKCWPGRTEEEYMTILSGGPSVTIETSGDDAVIRIKKY